MDLNFLLGTSVVAVLIVQVLKDIFGKVSDRWGALMAQLSLLAVSFGLAGIGVLVGKLPPHIIATTLAVFAGAISIYEVFWKMLYQDVVKGGKKIKTQQKGY